MSASRERKKRSNQEQNVFASAPQTKQKKKLSEGWIFAIVIALVLALTLGGLFGFRAWQRNQTVLTVGDHEVNVKEFNYFYNSTAMNYFNYASYFGFDTTIPLDEQKVESANAMYLGMMVDTSYLDDKTAVDGVYDATMADLVAYTARGMAIEAYTIYNAAVEAGYELDAECYDEIDVELESVAAYGDLYSWSLNETLENLYGKGCNEDNYRHYLEVVHVAQHYPATLSYSEEELKARYDESPENYDVASLYVYTISPEDFAETDEEGNVAEVTEAEEEKAKIAAENMEKEFDLESEYLAVYADYTKAAVENVSNEEAAEWLFGEAEDGAVKLFVKETKDEETEEVSYTYYVLKLIGKENYATSNIMQIYIADDAEDAELAEGQLTAEEKLAKVTEGLEADASEANFEALSKEYGAADNELAVEGLTYTDLAGVSNDALLWMAEEGRKEGDYAQFDVDGGTIVLLLTGYGKSYRDTKVTETLTTEWMTELAEAAKAVCGYDEKAAMAANVGLVYANQEQ